MSPGANLGSGLANGGNKLVFNLKRFPKDIINSTEARVMWVAGGTAMKVKN
jgi:hypothetical protein